MTIKFHKGFDDYVLPGRQHIKRPGGYCMVCKSKLCKPSLVDPRGLPPYDNSHAMPDPDAGTNPVIVRDRKIWGSL